MSATETKRDTCPECNSENYGATTGEPSTAGGWNGDRHYTWGRYAGTQQLICDEIRCRDCGHVEPIPVDWD